MQRGSNLFLRVALALLVTQEFEFVAKITIAVAGLCFVFDPFAGSRIFALIAVLVVNVLNRVRANHQNRPQPI